MNPYDSRTIFAVATDQAHPEGAVFLSLNGGATFDADEVLTALLTNSGSYRLGITDIIPLAAEVGSTFHGGQMFNPSHIAFSPANSSYVAVCSPVTGVFFANTARGCLGVRPPSPGPSWQTITPFLPNPYSYISAAGFDTGRLYVATQGRGLLFVDDPVVAPPATYLDPGQPRSSNLAVLRNNVAAPVTSAQVGVQMDRLEANTTGNIPMETRIRVVDDMVAPAVTALSQRPQDCRTEPTWFSWRFPATGPWRHAKLASFMLYSRNATRGE